MRRDSFSTNCYTVTESINNIEDNVILLSNLKQIFEEKMQLVIEYLEKNRIKLDDWNIDIIKDNSKIVYNKILDEYLKKQDGIWNLKLSNYINDSIEQYTNEFLLIDEEEYDSCAERYQTYFDILCDMFDETYNYIKNCYVNFNTENKETNLSAEIIAQCCYENGTTEEQLPYSYTSSYTSINPNIEKEESNNQSFAIAA